MNYLKEQYEICFTYIRQIMKLILLVGSFFFGVIIMGFLLGLINKQMLDEMMKLIQQVFAAKDIMTDAGEIDTIKLIANNLVACLSVIMIGFVPLLCLPMLAMLSNAIIIGIVGAISVTHGLGILTFLAGIVPHGIFEIPALIISGAMGLFICFTLTTKLLRRTGMPIKEMVHKTVLTYVYVLVPLLIVAGLIEVYITPLLLG